MENSGPLLASGVFALTAFAGPSQAPTNRAAAANPRNVACFTKSSTGFPTSGNIHARRITDLLSGVVDHMQRGFTAISYSLAKPVPAMRGMRALRLAY